MQRIYECEGLVKLETHGCEAGGKGAARDTERTRRGQSPVSTVGPGYPHGRLPDIVCAYVCVRARVRACVRACVRVNVRVYMCVCARACVTPKQSVLDAPTAGCQTPEPAVVDISDTRFTM
jgi:hypothetical protein